MFEERYSDILRINVQKINEMTLHKDIAQVELGLALSPEEELPPIFMKLNKYKEKKT